jgi:hypothetical protein
MGLFKTKNRITTAGPRPADMRGRASEISDPSPYGWEVMWEALTVGAPLETENPTLTRDLGLDEEQLIRNIYVADPATEFSGIRQGREVALRIGVVPGIREKGYNEVHVKVPAAPFRLRAEDGRIVVVAGSTPELAGVVGTLAPAPNVWQKLEIEGGADGIVARRPVTAHPQGYLYDLWLIERLADELKA